MIGIDVLAGLLFVLATVLCLALPVGILWLVYRLLLGGVWLSAKLVSGISWMFGTGTRRVGSFVKGEVVDVFGLVGSSLAAAFLVPMTVVSVFVGRWSRANHYGRALTDEVQGVARSAYRIAVGHPAQLFGLKALTRGIEERVPAAVRTAPGRDKPPVGPDGEPSFPGYVVIGSLPRGGSGAHLYLAEPLPEKYDRFAADGRACPGRVVVKHFSRTYGSTLPQILRENRALSAARNLGLVLDHQENDDGLYYVMPFVPGDDLAVVTRRLHDQSGPEGLDEDRLRLGAGYVADVLESLDRFHAKGLWHKDIKPSNVIVSTDRRAYVVDLGLVTPLASAMTLTTHGTEYFRDPEMVRLAMQGVKVHEVSGVKFDLYSAGAVLYSILENSFPAHGGLSTVTKRCPEAMRWVVRRAMADINGRYASAREMLADVRCVLDAPFPYELQPSDLPSTRGDREAVERLSASMQDPFSAFPSPPPPIDVPPAVPKQGGMGAAPKLAPKTARQVRREAREAFRAARAEAKRTRKPRSKSKLAAGVVVSSLAFMGLSLVPLALIRGARQERSSIASHQAHASSSGSRWSATEASVGTAGQHALALADALDSERHGRSNRARWVALALASDEPVELLVLNDLPATVAAEHTLRLIELLDGQNFNVIGLEPAMNAGTNEIELLAQARHSAGVSSPVDELAVQRLAELVRSADDLDAILWLGEGDAEGEVVYRLIDAERPTPPAAARVPAVRLRPESEAVVVKPASWTD